MAQKRFGGRDSTGRKLDVISEYLSMYQKALTSVGFDTVYLDGFAGSGEIPLTERTEGLFDEEVKSVITGSAVRALEVEPAFTRYVFIDQKKRCIEALQDRFRNNPLSSRISYSVGDANEQITAFCESEQWRGQRGVVLLDPFGNQVCWETVEAIAATKALDLWYLFPAGLGVFRQIGRNGKVDPTHEPSITRLFGTEEWKSAFLTPSDQADLFGNPVNPEKTVTPESAAEFMMTRLSSVFQGGVMDQMIPLGKHSYASYYLLFAWGNPSEKATRLANKLARAAVKATDRKYGRLI